MDKGKLGSTLVYIGLFMVGVIFLADAFGFSEKFTGKESPGFGIYQISGIVLGIIFTAVGWFLRRTSE